MSDGCSVICCFMADKENQYVKLTESGTDWKTQPFSRGAAIQIVPKLTRFFMSSFFLSLVIAFVCDPTSDFLFCLRRF